MQPNLNGWLTLRRGDRWRMAVTFAGGVLGTVLGFASRFAFEAFDVPAGLSPWFVFAALGCAVATGLVAGIVPARRAAGLDPVSALAR